MKKAILLIAFFGCVSIVSAQRYNTAVGVRVGTPFGLTAKHFLGSPLAVEGMLGLNVDGFYLVGLLEMHTPLPFGDNWYGYFGAGGHLAMSGNNNNDPLVIGVDGIAGLGYNFSKFPIDLSLDFNPNLDIINGSGFNFYRTGFSARYIF
ncbi:MAG: hypothetical protein KDC92_05900 [Bacteroidetes bacterium]|nr:hypothetical protein [Bacteroidota bacterium]